MNPVQENKLLKIRFHTAESAIRDVLREIFSLPPTPADRTLGDFYRTHRNCGSRDRSLVNNSVFALLRHWGFLRKIMPQAVLEKIETGRIQLQSRDILAMLLFALITDNAPPEITKELAAMIGVPEISENSTDPFERAERASEIFGTRQKFSGTDLAPDFRTFVPQDWDYDSYCRRLAKRPPLWIRAASQSALASVLEELKSAGLEFYQHGEVSCAITSEKVNLQQLPGFQNGLFEVQDLASQCVGLVCAPSPGERWYDACAGAGGKTLHLASLMNGKGVIHAGDIRPAAIDALKKRARRAGWSNISAKVHDGKVWKGKNAYDGVLVDAPCSGSGVWRRNPGLQWTLSENEIKEFASRQLEILENNAPAVKAGGTLIYATCSIFELENESVANKFLERHPDFVPEEFNHPLTGEKCCGAMRSGNGAVDSDELFAFKMRKVK
jgi:16S rRNA (cytosine967-C5)-methyltransferase